MRLALFLPAVVVAVVTGRATASPVEDGERVRVAIDQLIAALDGKDVTRVLAALAPEVELSGVAFGDKKCRKAFAGDRTVKGKARRKLAACLVTAPKLPTAQTEFAVLEHVGAWVVEFPAGTALWYVNFVAERDPQVLTRITGTEVEVGGDPGTWYGKVGGAVVLRSQPKLVQPTTPAPAPAKPPNVSPVLLEKSRLTGSKDVPADGETVKQARAAGKVGLISSHQMCLDATGAVTTTRMLRSSGFPTYDAAIEAAMKTWTYKPYLDDQGAAIPVCTAVTFIQKLP